MSFPSKTAENVADDVSEMCDGNFAKGAATAVGFGQEYNIATNDRMGKYEKTLMTEKTLATGLVSNSDDIAALARRQSALQFLMNNGSGRA